LSAIIDDPQARILILLLWDVTDREAGVAIVDLAEAQRDEALLSACHGEGLIEFIRRKYCYVGGGEHQKLVLENGWNVAELYKAGRQPVWKLIREAIAEQVDRDIRYRIRLTNRGCDVAGVIAKTSSAQSTNGDFNALNNALNALTKLNVSMMMVSQHLAAIQRQSQDYDLGFAPNGNLSRICRRGSRLIIWEPGSADDRHEFLELCSNCEWFPKHVKSLWESQREADDALGAVPRRLLENIDALTARPWLPSVRRYCLDLVLKWPGETTHQSSLITIKINGRIDEMLANAVHRDPFPTWAKFCDLLDQYGHDLVAIRDAVQPSPLVNHVTAPQLHAVSRETNSSNSQTVSEIPSRFEIAYRAFEFAEQKTGKELSDRDAYEWLKENGIDGHILPAYETWQRYVRGGRRLHHDQKNSPRGARVGRSIVRPDEI